MTDTRQAFIDGLHQIADFLTEHPEVPLPYMGPSPGAKVWGSSMPIYLVNDKGQRETLAEIARAMGRVEKHVDDGLGRFYVVRHFAGIALVASAERSEVCERVVTGTREVTTQVRDPEALAAVPLVTVTATVEDVEWVCTPLLKPAATGLQFVEVPS